VPHFHALISGVNDMRRDEVSSWRFERYSIAWRETRNRSRGAGFSPCKYVAKESGDIQFSKKF